MVGLKFAIGTVLPLIICVLIGCLFKRNVKYSKEFFAKLNNLNFDLFLPVMLYTGIYGIKSLADVNWAAVIVCMFGIVVMFIIGYFIQRLNPNVKQRGVMWQDIFRSNFTLIGIPLAQAIGGDAALAFASAISAFIQFPYNLLGIYALNSADAKGKGQEIKEVFKKLAKNPLVRACFLGIITLIIRSFIPKGADGVAIFTIEKNLPHVFKALTNLKGIASPLALVTLGAQFSIPKTKTETLPLVSITLSRLLLAPVVGIALAMIANATGIASFGVAEYPSVLAVFGTPVAVSSVVLAQSVDGDMDLANRAVVFTTILSPFSLILFLSVMRTMGLV